MVIKYTALVLGKNVASILRKFESPQKNGTATYCEMIDNFTDCLNVRSLTEGTRNNIISTTIYLRK